MRLLLIRLTNSEYKLVWTHHHILFDGWSLVLIMKRFLEIYNQMSSSAKKLLLQPALSSDPYYQWLYQQKRKPAEDFWKKELEGFSGVPELCFDNPEPKRNTEFHHQEQSIILSESETTGLKHFVSHHKLTLSTLFLGAWAILLNRYSRREDIVFGVTCSGRPFNVMNSDQMTGLFINTLPFRISFSTASR